MKRWPHARGFTLVEVLVALALMAAMAVIAWRGIDGMLRTREISQSSLLRSERLQTVMAQWELDLGSLQDATLVDPLAFDGARLLITRRQRDGMQVIVWSLRNQSIYRWASPVVSTQAALAEAYARGQQAQLQDLQQLPAALGGVQAWQMYFYRSNGWSNAQSGDDVTTETTGTTTTTRRVLPSGVRMVLEFAPGSGFDGTLMRQVLLGQQP